MQIISLYYTIKEKGKMSFYLNPKTQVLADLESNENGLTSTEAEARIEKYGKNKLIIRAIIQNRIKQRKYQHKQKNNGYQRQNFGIRTAYCSPCRKFYS